MLLPTPVLRTHFASVASVPFREFAKLSIRLIHFAKTDTCSILGKLQVSEDAFSLFSLRNCLSLSLSLSLSGPHAVQGVVDARLQPQNARKMAPSAPKQAGKWILPAVCQPGWLVIRIRQSIIITSAVPASGGTSSQHRRG